MQAPITGYRTLTDAEVALINEGKELANRCGAYLAKLRQYPDANRGGVLAGKESLDAMMLDQRWISIGATDIQRGFMAVIRGIAQPIGF